MFLQEGGKSTFEKILTVRGMMDPCLLCYHPGQQMRKFRTHRKTPDWQSDILKQELPEEPEEDSLKARPEQSPGRFVVPGNPGGLTGIA